MFDTGNSSIHTVGHLSCGLNALYTSPQEGGEPIMHPAEAAMLAEGTEEGKEQLPPGGSVTGSPPLVDCLVLTT